MGEKNGKGVEGASHRLCKECFVKLMAKVESKKERGVIKMSPSYEEDIIFRLTKDQVLACANELGIPKEQITDYVIESVKKRVSLEFSRWPEVVKSALKESFKCPLALVCYPSCFWWKDGKCTFPREVEGK